MGFGVGAAAVIAYITKRCAARNRPNARRLAEFLSKHGQFLLPMVDLIEQCRLA